ncbi:titin-like isoform X2 [Oscarella lobularis]|uniref:titin-like isoform X2 n=1 Tax=Oscarella lobularis TaxID=121494 RepID=UPI003313E0F3
MSGESSSNSRLYLPRWGPEMICWSYLFVVAYCFVGFTHEQKVAIDPSGSLRGREGTHVLVRGAYTFVFVEARISYNGKESDGISVVRNEKKNVSIVPFRTLTTGLGSNATHRLFQFEFTLLPQYNGSTIRVVGLDGNGVKNYTQPLRLTVQYPPCCNGSLQHETRNVTDSVISPLNCSEIISEIGNPAVTKISWTITTDSLKCAGMSTGSLNELYTFNPSDNLRNCNNANVICRAANEVGSTTKKYALIFNSAPGIPRTSTQGQPTPLPNGIIIAWQAPTDDGGFKVLDYKYDVISETGSIISSKNVPSTTTSARISGLGVAESYNFSVSAGNALGRSGRLNVSFESPDVPRAVSGVQSRTVNTSSTEISWSLLTVDVSFEVKLTQYVISIVNGTANQNRTVSGDTSSVIFAGLPSGSYFNFSVYALNGVRGGIPRRTFVTGMTNPTGTPGTPEKLTVASMTSTCVTLTWRSVDAGGRDFVIKRYIVLYSSQGSNTTKADVKTVSPEYGPDVEHSVCELTSGTSYTFQVAAENQVRRGRLSESVTTTTDEVFDFPVGLVVGLTIGIPVVVGIGFFIVAYFCCCRKRKKTENLTHASRAAPDSAEMKQMTKSPIYDSSQGTGKGGVTAPVYADVTPVNENNPVLLTTTNPTYQTAVDD